MNFAVGFVALLSIAAIATGLSPPHGWSAPPLEYPAGLIGAAIATTMAVLVSRLGVLRLILALTAGQAIGGLALDLVAPGARRDGDRRHRGRASRSPARRCSSAAAARASPT